MNCRPRVAVQGLVSAASQRFHARWSAVFLTGAMFVLALAAQTTAPSGGTQSQPNTHPVAPAVSSTAPAVAAHPAFFVVIDPAHGGSDSGARFTDKLLEKDITLAISRRLRSELQNRGIIAVLLRDNDSTLTYDQRAVSTNAQRAGLYVAVHAGTPGAGVRVYTALMPSDAEGTRKNKGPFLPWETAQADHLERSGVAAGAMVMEMNDAKIAVSHAGAPLKPLNNIAAPAIAIEVAPPASDARPDSLATQRYQQAIAAAVANAIARAKPKIEERRP